MTGVPIGYDLEGASSEHGKIREGSLTTLPEVVILMLPTVLVRAVVLLLPDVLLDMM